MSTSSEDLVTAMRVQQRDYTLWAFTGGIAVGLLIALVVVVLSIVGFA